MHSERRTRRSSTVTLVAVAVGLCAMAIVLMILAAFVDEFRLPVILTSIAFAFAGLLLIAFLHGGDPFSDSASQTPVEGEALAGRVAEVRSRDMVYVNGALWKAECDEPLVIGEKVGITGISGLTLKVRRQS